MTLFLQRSEDVTVYEHDGDAYIYFGTADDAKAVMDGGGVQVRGVVVKLEYYYGEDAGDAGGGNSGGGGSGLAAAVAAVEPTSAASGAEDGSTTLFFRGAPPTTTRGAMLEWFPEALELRFLKNKQTGQQKGDGQILFNTVEQARTAIAETNGKIFNGNALQVEFSKYDYPGNRDGASANAAGNAAALAWGGNAAAAGGGKSNANNPPHTTLVVENLAPSVTEEMLKYV